MIEIKNILVQDTPAFAFTVRILSFKSIG